MNGLLTEEKEDYLKAILYHDGVDTFVTNKTLSQYLNIKPPSVNEMLGRLEKFGYVHTKPYKGVKLSEQGLTYTLDIIKRHRLIELFLIQVLKYNWEEVHEEAEVLEHRVSKLFVERLDALLGFPETCPHGGVIPRTNEYREIYTTSLNDFEEGEDVVIRRVRDKTDLLIYLTGHNISIGDIVHIEKKDPINHIIQLVKGTTLINVSYENAQHIYVEGSKTTD